jgi:hypothetical protein
LHGSRCRSRTSQRINRENRYFPVEPEEGGVMTESMKDFCLGMTEQELDLTFQDKWDSLFKQIYKDGVYYQVCLDNGVAVDLYAVI